MQEFIARANIKRFEEQLLASTDPVQLKMLASLLDVERQRLAAALSEKAERV